MQSVDIYVYDTTSLHNPVEGVMVRVFDETGATFQSQQATDALGHAGFTLAEDTYSLRFYKFGVQVPQPQLIEVTTLGPNAFNAYGVVFVHPVSTDARLCRCSGYFRDITGAPHAWVDIMFIGQFSPILLESSAVVSERRTIRTGKDGYACIDLIRCAEYMATIQGYEDTQRKVQVPDLPSCNLPDLLFPVVSSVSFDLVGPYNVAVGSTLVLQPTVVDTAGVPIGGVANCDVQWSSSDDTILAVAPMSSTELVLTGVSAGTAELRATRRNTSIIRIPDVAISGVPQTVTVA